LFAPDYLLVAPSIQLPVPVTLSQSPNLMYTKSGSCYNNTDQPLGLIFIVQPCFRFLTSNRCYFELLRRVSRALLSTCTVEYRHQLLSCKMTNPTSNKACQQYQSLYLYPREGPSPDIFEWQVLMPLLHLFLHVGVSFYKLSFMSLQHSFSVLGAHGIRSAGTERVSSAHEHISWLL